MKYIVFVLLLIISIIRMCIPPYLLPYIKVEWMNKHHSSVTTD